MRWLYAMQKRYHASQGWYQPVFRERGFPAPPLLLRSAPFLPIVDVAVDSARTSEPVVALTFDACAQLNAPLADTAMIRALRESRTPATFFLGGAWVLTHPELARELADTPFFEIANHSYLHGQLTHVSADRMYWEIKYTQDIVLTMTGRQCRFFRPPYLEWNSHVTKTAADMGLILVGGTATGDPDPSATAPILIDRIGRLARPGSIFILHVNGRGWHTAEALPGILRILASKQLRPVTLSEMTRLQMQTAPSSAK